MKDVYSFLLLFTLILFGSVPLHAAESIGALKARARNFYYGSGGEQNYTKALQLYLQAADLGDAEAQYVSGGMLFKGMGAAKDINRAFRLLYQAAVNGQSSAASEQLVGQAFLLGAGLPKNYAKAIDWYTKAAANGNIEAQNELGFLYFLGKGVDQDIDKGGAYFLMAARGGLPVAQYNVGIMYATGRGVEGIDISQAYAWLNIAAAGGHKQAKVARDYLETVIDKVQLDEAQRLTEEMMATLPQ